MTREIWRQAPGFDAYEISNKGRIRRAKPAPNGAPVGKILKAWIGFGGEAYISLRDHGKTFKVRVSDVYATAFPSRKARA